MSYSNLTPFVNRLMKSRLVIYQNLPFGGGLITYQSVVKYIKDYQYLIIRGIHTTPKTIIDYLWSATFKNFYHDYIESKKIQSSDFLIVFQNWLSYAPPILLFTKKIKTIYICHEPPREYSDTEYIKLKKIKNRIVDFIRLPIKCLDYFIVRKSTSVVISNSIFSQKQIKKYYGISSRVVYPGYDDSMFNTNMHVKKKYQVVCVGAINQLKNQEFIIKVVSRLEVRKPRIVFVCNGYDSNYLATIKKLALELGVNLIVYKNISTNKLSKLYQESLLYIYAPINEPFGLTILEAMACGLPLVVYKYGGGYSELLSKNCGEILDNLNIDLWADKINNLLISNKLNNISRHNSDYAKKYTDRLYLENLLKSARL